MTSRALTSATRKEIDQVAWQHGWFPDPTQYGMWAQAYVRVPQFPDCAFKRIATMQGWTPTERVYIVFTDAGAVHSGQLNTPADQAALDGKYTSTTSRVKVRDRKKKETVLEWLRAPSWDPEE